MELIGGLLWYLARSGRVMKSGRVLAVSEARWST